MINPAYDIWVWSAAGLFLVMVGARAWVVETGQGRLGRTPVKVQVLTGATVVVLAGLLGLMAMQGGVLLVDSIVTGTDPAETQYGSDPATEDPAAGDPAAVDPAAPPADPAAPPADAPPPADPAAPPG